MSFVLLALLSIVVNACNIDFDLVIDVGGGADKLCVVVMCCALRCYHMFTRIDEIPLVVNEKNMIALQKMFREVDDLRDLLQRLTSKSQFKIARDLIDICAGLLAKSLERTRDERLSTIEKKNL